MIITCWNVGPDFDKMKDQIGDVANSPDMSEFAGKISSIELSVGYLFKCIGTKK